MLKKELAELLKSAKDDDNIDEAISKSELGKALTNSGLTLDAFKNKVSTDAAFKSFMDSEKDKHLQKGIETYKTNNLQKLVDEEYKKQHPEADPKDTKLAEMERKIQQMEKDTLKKDLTNKALKFATEKKLPVELIDFIVGNDEAATTANLEKLAQIFTTHDESIKKEILKDNTYVPPAGGGAHLTENPWSKDHYNLTMQGKILRENPELAKKYMAEAK
jgi:hypothetical protein